MAGGIQVASLYASIGADTGGLQTGLSGAKSSLTSFGKDFAKEAVSIASTAAIAIGAIKGIADITIDAANDWADYNLEMDKGATATGMMADEYSRLIQAADDAFVSQENMTKAMEMATKNGYPITIESLGQIADKLNAIKDPAEKAQKATEIFGRGWADIMPFLKQGSEGIENATESINDNLVATEDSIKKSKEYKVAIDNWTDSWTGFRNEVGGKVLPLLTDVVDLATSGMQALDDFQRQQAIGAQTWTNAIDDLTDARNNGLITETEYNSVLGQVQQGYLNAADVTDFLTKKTDNLTESESDLLMKLFSSSDSWEAFSEGAARAGLDLGMINEELFINEKALNIVTQSSGNAYDYMMAVGGAVAGASQEVINLTAAYEENARVLNEQLSEATLNLNVQMQTFTDSVAGNLYQGLLDAGLSAETTANRVALLDDVFGTTFGVEYEMKMKFPDLLNDLIKNPEKFKDSAKAFTDYFGPLQASVQEAQEQVNQLKAELAAGERQYQWELKLLVEDDDIKAYKPPTLTGYINYIPHTSKGNMDLDVGGPGKAVGGPVMGNSPYIVGEQGPELFVPESSGAIVPAGQTAGLMGSGDSGLLAAILALPSAKDIARAVRDAVLLAG